MEKSELKILVADDDDSFRSALAGILKNDGYSVIEASDGLEAVDVFEREAPDIVLLDGVMPQLDGFEACARIRAKVPDILELPILIITIMSDIESIEKAQVAGASDYLTKPLSWPLLMYRINVLFLLKKMQLERSRLNKRLRETHKLNAVRQLTGGFSHDFNNILAAQLGYTELALDCVEENDTEKHKEYLGEIQKASLRAKLLIEQLMNFTLKDIDLTSASMVCDVFGESTKVLTKNVPDYIDYESVNKIDNGWIPLSFIQFHEVIMNLFDNAIDAIDGQGTVKISLEESNVEIRQCSSCLEDFGGSYYVLSCEDSGKGILPNDVHRVFEPFYTTKMETKGVGHGMSVIHGIAHAAGGHVEIDSVPGKGTIARVFFKPIKQEVESAACTHIE